MVFKHGASTFGMLLYVGASSVFAQNTLSITEPEAHFRNGLEYYEKSNYVAARQEFNEFLGSDDKLLSTTDYNKVTAEYYVAVTGLYLNYPEAEVQVDRFVKNHSEHPKAQQIYGDLGRYYYESGQYDKAITYLEKAVNVAGSGANKLESAYQLAMSYYNTQQLDAALPLFNQVKTETSFANAGDASFYAGVINYQKNKFEEAYQDFQRIEDHPYYKNEAPNWIISSLYQLKRYDELLTYGEKILKSQRGNTKLDDVALYVAEVYYEKGDYAAAVTSYERYKRMKPGVVPPTVALHYGHAQFRNGNYEGAITNLKPIGPGKDSVSQYASYILGISYLKTSNLSFALTSFDDASKLDFNPVVKEEAAYNHAKVQLESGNNNEAVKEFNDFMTKYPESKHTEEATELVAEGYASASNSVGAIKYIEGLSKRNTKINGTYQRLTYNQGVLDFNAQRFDNAIAMFDKSIKFPLDEQLFISATYYKAESTYGLNKVDEAANLYTQISKNPKAGVYARKSLYALGYIYYNQKKYAQALTYFKEFTSNIEGIEPLMIEDGFSRLADCYLAAKNYNEAIKTYEQVSAKGKVDKDYALFQKARAYVYMNREQEARKQFDQLISQYPQSRYLDDAYFQLADIDFQKQSYSAAVKGFTRMINEKPKSNAIPAALLRRAQSYYNLQVYEQAIVDFRKILTEYPDSPSASSALEGIQEAYTAVGRPEEFTQVLGVVRKNNPGNEKLEEVEFDNVRNLYYAEKYENAINSLQSFIQSYPASKHQADATYFIASSYDKIGKVNEALEFFGKVVQQNKSTFVAAAAQRSAELEIGRGNYNNAVSNFRVLLRNSESKKEQAQAWVGLMDTYYTLKSYDSTLYYAKEVINAGNLIPGAVGKAQLYAGKVPFELGDFTKAGEEFRKIAASSKDEYGAEASYWSAMVLYKNKKYKEAETAIIDMGKNFEGYDYWRVRSFILLAEVYVGLNEMGQAKATLTSIIDNSDDKEAVELAKEKLAQISK
ncbi:tetratricopeptide repeat protein [Dyadobacter fanqingshengii]|uniref:Tetratricopeptide repeat protein n=1 Tax=Dyadobacter fanqingshengii TaxID=2906443 RepID=A0A9X1T9Z7_9BACT|nr:tetratricopeptide repeat protein [Dyadobacter fanqingshengii]MCF0040983.1 tetratricopeptide repeat protein [Dyadobacter fanqingshengii]USJ37286.1 tetratricopeptide repeat protein [Dyadobacter fanqingshengii]